MTAVLALPTGATEVLPPDPPRDVWLAERRKSIGGSDASTLVDLNPYGSRMQLWLDKTGQLPPLPINSAIEWGVLLEPVVREWTARTYQVEIRPSGLLRRADHPFIHANPDGIEFDEHGQPISGFETKQTSWRLAYQWADGQCPDHAELQAQLCMFVTGLRRWRVVGLIDGRDPQVRMVHADDALGEMLADEAAQFFADHIDPMLPPAIDGSTATDDAIRAALAHPTTGRAVVLTNELFELFRAHAAAKDAVKAAEEAERAAGSALRMALGGAEQVVDDPELPADLLPKDGGRTVYATWINNGTFSAKTFAEAHPDEAAECTVDAPQLDCALVKARYSDLHTACRARTLRTRKPLNEILDPKDAA